MAGRAVIFGLRSSRTDTGTYSFCSGAYTCIVGFGSTSRTSDRRSPAAAGFSVPDTVTRRCAVSIGAPGSRRPAGSPRCADAGRGDATSVSATQALQSARDMFMMPSSYYGGDSRLTEERCYGCYGVLIVLRVLFYGFPVLRVPGSTGS